MCYKCNKKDVGSLDVEIGKSVNSILQGAFFFTSARYTAFGGGGVKV